ncbi:MAG: TolC family protein [Planctomycetes bacterium]|nr:TolC family protein [Planctomycetota bacterium]
MAPLREQLWFFLLAATCLLNLCPRSCVAESFWPWIKPEQQKISVRHPSQLPHIALPDTPRPPTVSDLQWDGPTRNLSLDEAIRTALSNSEVIRVLGGVTAVASGRTIYDVAISNANIDVAQGRFDPTLSVDNFWNRRESPFAFPDPGDPTRTLLDASRSDAYDLNFDLSKTNLAGGTWSLGVNDGTTRVPGAALLDPANRTSLDFSYTQPLLRGSGRAANQVPIVLARINTERSYFQYKSSVQQQVRDVIGAYWALVSARTVLWARQQQVYQADFALKKAEAGNRVGNLSPGETALPRVTSANFKSILIAAKADVLQREAALRSIMGLPAYEPQRITPVTPPSEQRLHVDWETIVSMAEQYRPDIIELKLVLETDQQRLLQARNLALPQVNAFGLYRWNGLDGVMPVGDPITSSLNLANDWTLGINFSVPIGLRASRAQLRQQELILSRDRAQLTQGLLTASHLLAANLRNLEQFFEQYQATHETRAAARDNLEYQMANVSQGLFDFINTLQAIVSWGDAVSAEAQLLALYNTEQANLELQTGTILETHGIFFYEERYGSIGPLGRLGSQKCYPRAKPPSENDNLYPVGDEPAEEFFDLTDPLQKRKRPSHDTLPPLDLPPLPEPIEEVPKAREFQLQQPRAMLPQTPLR